MCIIRDLYDLFYVIFDAVGSITLEILLCHRIGYMFRSNGMTKYLVSFYTFRLKQIACILIGSDMIQCFHHAC
jgi:hypothetical protein